MAVEARHPGVFPQQLLRNGEIMNPIEANSNMYNTQLGYGLPLSGTTTADTFLPFYGCVVSDSFPPQQKPAIKSDSNLTYQNNNNNLPLLSRKRSREFVNPLLSYPPIQTHNKSCTPFVFLGDDMSIPIQEQQFEVDRLISQHMEKVRMEIQERRKKQARRIMDAIGEGVMKKLKAKEGEIEKIGKLNWALEERVKSLCIENQIWRDLAQTNEATANALRTNLEQVLAAATQHKEEGRTPQKGFFIEEVIDDAASCCGSSWEDNGNVNNFGDQIVTSGGSSSRLCRNCSKEESCVLLLPCRHLCLCNACGSTLHTCPLCKSPKTVSVHVNMS